MFLLLHTLTTSKLLAVKIFSVFKDHFHEVTSPQHSLTMYRVFVAAGAAYDS